MLNMGAVLLLLIGVADGLKTFCDATEPNITTQCFGSLGGTVEVLLPTKTSQNDTYRLKKDNVPIVNNHEAEDVTYADVSVLQRRGQRREQGEGEVEYGAVRVAPGPRRTLETNVDECVYAQPQSTRP
ncbi:unnamed protein product [Gadus morhua 'NCC']